MDYLDFDLKIEAGRERSYPVTVLDSPAGQAQETMRFPFDQEMLDMHLLKLQNALLRSGERRRKSLSLEEDAVRDFGRALFQALFVGEVGSLYRESVRMAQREDKGLRLKLRIVPPDLAALPWEFLNDPRSDYLCLSPDSPIVRYPEIPHPGQEPLSVTLPLRILGMVASPHDQRALNVEEEKQRLETALAPLQARGLVELTWLAGQMWRDLQEALWRGGWHVFHFIGHGGFDSAADEGFLALADEQGNTKRFHAGQLARLLTGTRSLRFALLNACEGAKGSQHDLVSSTAAALVHRGLPGVLAMQYDITDHAAIELSRTFYKALAEGLPIDFCVTEGRRAISLADGHSLEWGIPVLYLRAAHGRLFDIIELQKINTQQPDKPALVSLLGIDAKLPGFSEGIASLKKRALVNGSYSFGLLCLWSFFLVIASLIGVVVVLGGWAQIDRVILNNVPPSATYEATVGEQPSYPILVEGTLNPPQPISTPVIVEAEPLPVEPTNGIIPIHPIQPKLTFDPPSEQNFMLGETIPITLTVTDQRGIPLSGISVRITEEFSTDWVGDLEVRDGFTNESGIWRTKLYISPHEGKATLRFHVGDYVTRYTFMTVKNQGTHLTVGWRDSQLSPIRLVKLGESIDIGVFVANTGSVPVETVDLICSLSSSQHLHFKHSPNPSVYKTSWEKLDQEKELKLSFETSLLQSPGLTVTLVCEASTASSPIPALSRPFQLTVLPTRISIDNSGVNFMENGTDPSDVMYFREDNTEIRIGLQGFAENLIPSLRLETNSGEDIIDAVISPLGHESMSGDMRIYRVSITFPETASAFPTNRLGNIVVNMKGVKVASRLFVVVSDYIGMEPPPPSEEPPPNE